MPAEQGFGFEPVQAGIAYGSGTDDHGGRATDGVQRVGQLTEDRRCGLLSAGGVVGDHQGAGVGRQSDLLA